MKKKYSKLSESQRAALQAQGCTSDSWDSIEVGDGFRTDFVRDAHFGGKVRLGANGTRSSCREAWSAAAAYTVRRFTTVRWATAC